MRYSALEIEAVPVNTSILNFVGSINKPTQILEGVNSIYKLLIINYLQESKMYRINLRKMQKQTQEILSWFGPYDLRLVPKQSAWDFHYPDFDKPQNQLLIHHLTKQPLPNLYNSSLHQEDNNSLNDYNESYRLWNLYVIVNRVSYRWTLRILHNRIGIVWRNESRN